MNSPHSLPTLRIIPVKDLLLHENHDSSRTDSLKERLRSEGLLRNPPIVAPLEEGASRYVVLDGANRSTALRTMSIPHILAQVVEPSKNISLNSWNHVLLDTDTDNFLVSLQIIPDLDVCQSDSAQVTESSSTRKVGWVLLSTGEKYTLSIPTRGRVDSIAVLNRLERTCRKNGRYERTSLTSLEALEQVYPNFSALVIYHALEVSAVLSIAKSGNLLPAGITRFLVSPRALRVNYPLKELVADKPLAEKNDTLQKWIHGRVTERGIRCYEESTVLFDE
jgi:hypothetical protein